MKLMIVKCPGCGATVELDSYDGTIRCQYCNLPILVEEKLEDITKLNKYLKLGERYYRDKEYKEAYINYQKAIEIEPDNEITVLRKGLTKSLCTDYKEFQIEYAINGMKNCYALLKKKDGDAKQINNCILECSNTIAELENVAMKFYQANELKLDFKEINEYILKLQLCLNGFEYLYSIIESNTKLETIIISGMITTIDNILQNKKYKIEKYAQNGEKYTYTKTYKLSKELKTQLLQKRQLCVNRQLEINPNAVVGKVKHKEENKIGTVLSYIMVAFSIIMALGSIFYPLVFASMIWLITAILFVPKVKQRITAKWKKSKTFLLLCRIILPIVAFFVLVLEAPYMFENVWIASNGMKVTLKENKISIQLEDGTERNGIYTQEYDNANYIIRAQVQADNQIEELTFHYIEENNIVTFYLEKDNQENLYFIPENPNTSYEYKAN